MKNKIYSSKGLIGMYSEQRNTWDEFYDSEKYIMEKVFQEFSNVTILDAGCGCGGLLKAIQNRFSIASYKGIDINDDMIAYARKRRDYSIDCEFECMDICDLKGETFDVVISFSCVDWNENVHGMIENCWDRVKPGGVLISSFRLTDKESILHGAYQTIDDYDETYNYVVFNFFDLKNIITSLTPAMIDMQCYGYWGKPSKTAVVDRDRLCFTVFAIRKGKNDGIKSTRMILNLPIDIM